MSFNISLHVNDSASKDSDQVHWEGGVIFGLGILSAVGNFICVIVLIYITKCKTISLAIFGHHCFLDFLKSLYCFPYGWNTIFAQRIPYCGFIGSSYVLITTTSAYNLLALVVNEEYAAFSTNQEGNSYCVTFGVVFVWFTSFLLNLGVSLIPANTFYIEEVHTCMFVYGKPESYVLHILWIGLVTCAIILSFKTFYRSYRRISILIKSSKWDAIHKSLIEDMNFSSSVNENCHSNKQADYHFHSRRILVYISLVTSYALFWYPLFLLTIVDYRFTEPKVLYKFLTVFAWSHTLLTPVFCFLIVRDLTARERLIRDLSSNHFCLKNKSCRLRRYRITEKETIPNCGAESDHLADLIDRSEVDEVSTNITAPRTTCRDGPSTNDEGPTLNDNIIVLTA
jgi:hypothetical protein